VAVNLDGFTLSHVIEPIMMPEAEEVEEFLPVYKPGLQLDPKNPISMGMFGIPEIYTETKKDTDEAVLRSKSTILKVWDEFEKQFGRKYQAVETYRTEDADVIMVIMGSIAETAMTTVDEMREDGQKVGLVRIRLWRPFPDEEFRAAVKGAKNLAVIDRCVTLGSSNMPVCQEIKSLLYHENDRPHVSGFTLGLGGRDAKRSDFKYICDRSRELADKGQDRYEMVGVLE
jgi:pyruvate ferredoxin oxidoreductase alpha subunit